MKFKYAGITLFLFIVAVPGAFIAALITAPVKQETVYWKMANDPNPAMQFSCKKLNLDFLHCRNWFIECFSSETFKVQHCIQLNERKKLKWRQP